MPETEVAQQEAEHLAEYDRMHVAADVAAEREAHDARCLQALRSWYHTLYAPDEDGDTYDFAMRVEDDEPVG